MRKQPGIPSVTYLIQNYCVQAWADQFEWGVTKGSSVQYGKSLSRVMINNLCTVCNEDRFQTLSESGHILHIGYSWIDSLDIGVGAFKQKWNCVNVVMPS